MKDFNIRAIYIYVIGIILFFSNCTRSYEEFKNILSNKNSVDNPKINNSLKHKFGRNNIKNIINYNSLNQKNKPNQIYQTEINNNNQPPLYI